MSSPAKTILIVGYVWPEPRSSAAGARMMQLIELFCEQGWQVTFASAAALSDYRVDLKSLGVHEQSIVLNCDSFDAFVAELHPDIVIFDRFFSEEQFGWRVERACPSALRVLDSQDLHSLRQMRHQLLKQGDGTPVTADMHTLFNAMAEDDIALREIAAIYRCDLTLIISEFELDFLQKHFHIAPSLLLYCPFLLKTSTFSIPTFADRQNFISIGSFRHAPNWDATLWLKQTLWPLIRKQLPQAQLHIYGSYPPAKAMDLHHPASGFYVDGWAEDAHEVMQQARVCLAPLRFGAGLKGKLVDAMQCGTPSVTTSIGAEGMHGLLPWSGIIADTADDFARAAVMLHQNEAAWQEARQNGQTIIQQRFDRSIHGPMLIERLNYMQQTIESLRRNNFIGSMLRHHFHKSTQYMSQWIASKKT